jgi:Ca2+-binding EF-hand superfamily protein
MAKVASGPTPLSLTFNADKYVTNYLDRETIVKLHEVFLTFDYDGSGRVSPEEMINTIKALNIESQLQDIMDAIHNSGVSGDMDFKMFVEVFGTNVCSTSSSNL